MALRRTNRGAGDDAARERARGAAGRAPVVTIEGDEARAAIPEGASACMKVANFVAELQPKVPDSRGAVLPDGVKCLLPNPMGFTLVHQTPPTVFSFRWIAPDSDADYGPGTRYRTVRLALPYVIVLAVFENRRHAVPQLSSRNECFFSNQPLDLHGLETELCFPALLNCSRFDDEPAHPLSWICTHNLQPSEFAGRPTLERSLHDGLRALLHHLFESGFNRSSEHHELTSWHTTSVEAAIDPRIKTVEDWEKASADDPLFVLEVPWLPTGRALGAIAQRIARTAPRRRSLESSADLARVILNARARRSA